MCCPIAVVKIITTAINARSRTEQQSTVEDDKLITSTDRT